MHQAPRPQRPPRGPTRRGPDPVQGERVAQRQLSQRASARRHLRDAQQSDAGQPHRRPRLLSPTRPVFLGFLAALAAGTGLLMLPAASRVPGGADLLDAAFTAVSALCVTGLSTVDTAAYWSPFGQIVILVLIQLGGLGVMTFASLLGFFVMHRVSLRDRISAAAEHGSQDFAHVRQAVFSVLAVSLTVEALVAVALTLRFWLHGRLPLGRALELGGFHAVSSFNNAGFALFSDNLSGFAADPFILVPISVSIVIGGLGFPVIMQLVRHRGNQRLWSMNTRLVLAGTVVLLIAGTVVVTALEWGNPKTLGPMPPAERLLNGFFQAVQTRTAGFSSVDIGSLHPATWLAMDVLMFIGAGPAGTGGGIKLTTFTVLFFIIVAEIRGTEDVNVFGKRLARSVHRQATTVALLSVALVVGSTALLMLLSSESTDRLFFEVVSAFATAGLSTGITASLPAAAKVILMALMFIGRLGPITFATALALRVRPVQYELPTERPIIG